MLIPQARFSSAFRLPASSNGCLILFNRASMERAADVARLQVVASRLPES